MSHNYIPSLQTKQSKILTLDNEFKTNTEKKKYDILVFIGRFQIFHNGHKTVVDRALEFSDRLLILVGSSNVARSLRNPFTFEEREEMIMSNYPDYQGRITIRPLDDMTYSDARWIAQVQRTVKKEVLLLIPGNTKNVYLAGLNDINLGLIGCGKDSTSYYLKLFPDWNNINVVEQPQINATDIRNGYFDISHAYTLAEQYPYLPTGTAKFLFDFQKTKAYTDLVVESDFIYAYKDSVLKYPRIEHTVDAVVIQSGHILLIRRRAVPGKGLWALPGGFVNVDETLLDAMIRELREETKIKVPEAVLRGSINKIYTYDDPNRSARGRLITQAYLIRLPDQLELPKVKGSDDADKARWVSLANLNPKEMFEDHYFIIQHMI